MAKHRSPCKVRYDKNNPPMSVRLTKDLREVLELVRGTRNYRKAAMDILTDKLNPVLEIQKNSIPSNSRITSLFDEVRNKEGLRRNRNMDSKDFLAYLCHLYKQVRGDDFVLDSAWEKLKET
jgi:hypothetical protein